MTEPQPDAHTVPPGPAPTPESPTVVVKIVPPGVPQVSFNMKGEGARLLANWMLDQAKMLLLTQPTDAERSQLVKPTNGIRGILNRLPH